MSNPIGMTRGDDLAGKVALVTGAARNIGRAISMSLAAGGAAVVVNAKTSAAEAEQTRELIEKSGGRASVHLADISDSAAVAAMVAAAVERYGRIDYLINNAVFRYVTAFEAITLAEWRHVLATVLDGAFICTQACLPHLKRSGSGAVINIGGLTGHEGARDHAHVVTAKAGLAGMTKALARDFASHAITVNCVVPGKIDTLRGAPGTPQRSAERHGTVPPVGRRGEAGEVAAMVRMLCGPEARYITGQSIHVNGGVLMP